MPVEIPVSRLRAHCNPFGNESPWGIAIAKNDVTLAIKQKRLAARPGGDDHAARIAYLVLNPARDPVELDVGCPSLNYWPEWPVTDGNHRLAAAIYRRALTLTAIVGGDLDFAFELFKVDCTEPELPVTTGDS